MTSLDGRVIAIAGAAGGLGPVVATRLADAGATLALTDRDQDRLDALAAELGLAEDRFDARVVDLLDEDAARGWADGAHRSLRRRRRPAPPGGRLEGRRPLATTPLDDYEWLHDLLVRTVIHTTRAFYEALRRASTAASSSSPPPRRRAPTGTNAAYAATKAAAEAWTLALADAFRAADSAATANIIVVNAILTPQMREDEPRQAVPTFTSAEDIAEAIAFLCSDAAAKMNGKRLALHP